MKKSVTRCILVALALVLLPQSPIFAGGPFKETFLINGQTYTVTRTESTSFNGSKSVSAVGTFSTAPGQTLTSTYIYTILPAGTGTAMGTVNSTAKTWNDSVGDPKLNLYYFRFDVSQNGRNFTYFSPTYTFGKQ
jgi:hypothetical protein